MPSDGTARSVRPHVGPPGTLELSAPAKVNLILKVLGRRQDGFHDIWSVMQTIGLSDRLTISLRPESSGISLACDEPSLPTDRRNLIYRAAERVLAEADVKTGVHIAVQKSIPVAAGLGGGSSDAAATILGLARLLALDWPVERLARLGEELGSDVPFFFYAPTAVAQGRGERVTALTLSGARWIVLVQPGFPIETRWAYERLAASRAAVAPLPGALHALERETAVTWDALIPLMANDFEAAVFPTHPVLADIKRLLLEQGAEAALLSGSGATMFGVFKTQEAAERAVTAVRRGSGRHAYAVKSGMPDA